MIKKTVISLLLLSTFAIAQGYIPDMDIGSLTLSEETATTVPYLDANKKVVSSAVTPTELGYLDGVTSAIQTQLDAIDGDLTAHIADTTTHGTTGDIVGTSDTQALSNKTVGLSDGTLGAPSLHFTGDTDNGLFRVGANNWEAVVGGVNALDFKISTGGYANIGFAGTAASTGDGVPFYLKRDQATSTAFRIDNANTNANAASIVQFNGNGYNAYVFAYSTANTNSGLDAKVGLWSLTGDGTSLISSDAAGTHGMYIGGAADANMIAEVTADGLNLLAEGELRLQDTTGGQYISLKAPGTVAANVSYTLPNADGSTGHFLSTNGSGTLSWGAAGSGTGKNYAQDLYGGLSVTGINTYKDAAATTPVDGTAGTATAISAAALNTTTELRGTSSQRLSKTAADGQGEGWSYDFTLDRADYEGSKPLIVSFRYKTSANYVADDVRVFVYDKDGAALLNVLSITNDGSLGVATDTTRFVGSFNAVSTSDDYRIILHVAGTNAAAWDLDIIDLSISPEQTVPGAIVTAWESYTPTWSAGFGTVTGKNMFWRRQGDTLHLRGYWTNGTVAGSVASMSLPTGLVVDSVKVPGESKVGSGTRTTASAAAVVVLASPAGTVVNFALDSHASIPSYTAQNGDVMFTSSESVFIEASVPISGWAASAALSTTETMMMGAKFIAAKSAAQTIIASTPTKITWTAGTDNLAKWDSSNNRYTVPRTGRYDIGAGVALANAASEFYYLHIYVNGAAAKNAVLQAAAASPYLDINRTIELNAGDYVEVFVDSTADASYDVGATTGLYTYFTINEVFDPTVFSVYGITGLYPATGYSSGGLVSYTITADQYGDLDSETLQPGEYDLDAGATWSSSGTTSTLNIGLGLSTTTGNSSTGLVEGENFQRTIKPTTSGYRAYTGVNVKGIVVTTPTTYYLKGWAQTSITNLQIGWTWRFRKVK